MQSGDVWIFYPSTSTGSLSSMFITKINDVAGLSWIAEAGCPDIHQKDTDPTIFSAYQIGTPAFGGDNFDSATSSIT